MAYPTTPRTAMIARRAALLLALGACTHPAAPPPRYGVPVHSTSHRTLVWEVWGGGFDTWQPVAPGATWCVGVPAAVDSVHVAPEDDAGTALALAVVRAGQGVTGSEHGVHVTAGAC